MKTVRILCVCLPLYFYSCGSGEAESADPLMSSDHLNLDELKTDTSGGDTLNAQLMNEINEIQKLEKSRQYEQALQAVEKLLAENADKPELLAQKSILHTRIAMNVAEGDRVQNEIGKALEAGKKHLNYPKKTRLQILRWRLRTAPKRMRQPLLTNWNIQS